VSIRPHPCKHPHTHSRTRARIRIPLPAHAPTRIHTQVCNAYCISTATTVSRARINVTLYVHCLSLFFFWSLPKEVSVYLAYLITFQKLRHNLLKRDPCIVPRTDTTHVVQNILGHKCKISSCYYMSNSETYL
jgi:hypothetical protein